MWLMTLIILFINIKFNHNFQAMGNTCQIDDCMQGQERDSFRRRSQSDPKQNMNLKNLIQIKKGKIIDDYFLNEIIGQGSYGCVYKVTHKVSKMVRAAKRIEKKKKSIQALQQSLILKKLDHPNIIRIYDIYYEKRFLYIVMDHCEGGQLFQRISKLENMTQNDARGYMKQILSAIHHCHSHGVMHRDLKPQNIMFLSKQAKDLKIIDFGVGSLIKDKTHSTLKVGSIYYMAPQVIKKKYNEKCDIWSIGIILYVMLTGAPPFIAKTDNEIYDLILKGELKFPQKKWGNISLSARDLVQNMLAYDASKRITAKQALSHHWIRFDTQLGNKKLYMCDEIQSIKRFCSMNNFQAAIMSYISHHFMQNQMIRELQTKFKSMDKNGDGHISWQQFKNCCEENLPDAEEQQLKSMFSKLDKNHSGSIDYSQFITSSINKAYMDTQNLVNKAFSMIDRDRNGYLSKEELTEAFGGCNQEIYMSIIKEFDVNHDGKISKHQFRAAMKELLKK